MSESPRYSQGSNKKSKPNPSFLLFDYEKLVDEKTLELEEAEEELKNTINDAKKKFLEKRIGRITKFLQHLEAQIAKIDEEDKGTSSLPPSKLDAENLEHARGDLRIRNRDSGVARHPLFYKLLQAMTKPTYQEMQNVLYEDTAAAKDGSLNLVSLAQTACWEHLVSSIQSLIAKNRGAKTIHGREVFFSGGITRSLNNLCRRRRLPFSFSHQYSCAFKSKASKEDTVDIAAFWSNNDLGDVVPRDELLGMIEVKKEWDGRDAKWQMCGYISEASESTLINVENRVSFGLTVDHFQIRLFGFTWDRPGCLLEHSLLWEEHIGNTSGCAKLLLAYFLSLAVLSDEKVRQQEATPHFCPGVKERVTRMHPKVFRSDDSRTMYKVFDYGKFRKGPRAPNLDVAKVLYGEKAELVLDSSDLGVFVLKMPWLEGNDYPTNCQQMISLCRSLQKLHASKHKHGDVLCQNIIFHENEASLIDFDFARVIEYPVNWNTQFLERHPASASSSLSKQSHDVYAAIAITCHYFELTGEEEGRIYKVFVKEEELSRFGSGCPFTTEEHPELNEEWKNAAIEKLQTWLTEKHDKLTLRPTSDLEPEKSIATRIRRRTTGSPPEKKA